MPHREIERGPSFAVPSLEGVPKICIICGSDGQATSESFKEGYLIRDPRWISRLIAPLLSVVAACEACRANAIAYEYGGVMQSVGADSNMTPGMRFSGTVTYDPATASVVLSSPNHTQLQ